MQQHPSLLIAEINRKKKTKRTKGQAGEEVTNDALSDCRTHLSKPQKKNLFKKQQKNGLRNQWNLARSALKLSKNWANNKRAK